MHRFALAFVLTAACGGAVSQIEVKGKDPDLATIAGDWEGNYQGIDNPRSGEIRFSLELGRHTADGEVLMKGSTKPLAIEFIAVQANQISGSIQPYTEPSCSCQVHTEFVGTVDGNKIDGTFTTKVAATGHEMHGTWEVDREGT
jgi:hypothetical protein